MIRCNSIETQHFEPNLQATPTILENRSCSLPSTLCTKYYGSGVIHFCWFCFCRIGILHLKDPVKILRQGNIPRISEVWLGEKKGLVYKSTGIKPNKEPMDYQNQVIATLQSRKNNKNCKDFDWYLSTVANKIYTPSLDAQFYGLLKVKSGGCAKIAADKRVELTDCNAAQYQLHPFDRIFELTDAGLLRNGNKCLVVQTNAYVLAQECNPEDLKHKWQHTPEENLKNVWSGYCAMHVTDPDKSVSKGRQIFMVQECTSDKDGAFTNWEFVSP